MSQPKPEPSVVAAHIANAPAAAKDLALSLQDQGWDAVVRRAGRIRFWCPGPCKHETWVDLEATELTYFARLRKHLHLMTCWKEETE